METAFGGNKDILEAGELRRGLGLWVRWDIFGFEKEKEREKLGEMRRRERERRRRGRFGCGKAKCGEFEGSSGPVALGLPPSHPFPSPTYPSHNPPPPACAATMMQATVSEVCAKGKEVLL